MSSALELQQLFAHHSLQQCNRFSRHIFDKLEKCHTGQMGMHHYQCDDPACKQLHQQYHSCGNRHCPNCGGLKKEQWVENLTAQLFPIGYYHVVFTLPHELNPLIMGNRKAMFDLLFASASKTLLQFSNDPQHLGATCGITMVLHTWGQNLSFHLENADRVAVYFLQKNITDTVSVRMYTASLVTVVLKTTSG